MDCPSLDTIQKILEVHYGFVIQKLMPITEGVMNWNFLGTTAHGQYIIKIYSYRTVADIQFEIDLLNHLEAKNFPAPHLVPSQNGEKVVKVEVHPLIVYKCIDGTILRDIDTTSIQNVGRLLGTFHSCTKDFVSNYTRDSWDPEDIRLLFNRRGHELVERQFPKAQELLSFIQVELSHYHFPSSLPQGIVHQDVKPENILCKDKKIVALLDFDNSTRGALIFDIMTTAIWTCFENEQFQEERFKALLTGYQLERQLEPIEQSILILALRWRLLRELFIAPLVTPNHMQIVAERTEYFKKLYRNLNT